MPVKPTEFCIDEARQGRTFVRQGRLSRHKVSVGEPADGSPPKIFVLLNHLLYSKHLAYLKHFADERKTKTLKTTKTKTHQGFETTTAVFKAQDRGP